MLELLVNERKFPGNVVPEITESMIEISTDICTRITAAFWRNCGQIRDALTD